MPYYVLLIMIFLHIIDDYCLQGILAKMKQKSWWADQLPSMDVKYSFNYRYRYDYIVALVMHSFSWTFMVMLPFYQLALANNPNFYALFVFNMGIHFSTDHAKANMKIINLVTDQSIHIMQILFTFYVLTHLI